MCRTQSAAEKEDLNMKRAGDLRAEAREALRGKWLIAILAGLLAMILNGALSSNGGVSFHFELTGQGMDAGIEFAGREIFTFDGGFDPQIVSLIVSGLLYVLLGAVALGILYFVLGSIVEVGYASFNLTLVDRLSPSIEQLFSYFSYWKTTALAAFWRTLYVIGWSLLFVIPGIVAGYSYAMTPYILAEHPEMDAKEAIRASKEMMIGNRWRLFCLELSFIGWDILAALLWGVGVIVLAPYKAAAQAAFYRELSGSQPRGNEFTLPDVEF